MPTWQDFHRRVWPGYDVPDLLLPIQLNSKDVSGQSFFQELTLPTSMMMSYLASGIANRKRNLIFRNQSAAALISLVGACCRSGKLRLTTQPVGSHAIFELPVPSTGILPQAAFVIGEAGETFTESWTWALNEFGLKSYSKMFKKLGCFFVAVSPHQKVHVGCCPPS